MTETQKSIKGSQDQSLVLLDIMPKDMFFNLLRRIEYRGAYDAAGGPVLPYSDAQFSLAKIYPRKNEKSLPTIRHGGKEHILYTSQPTIYDNQIAILDQVEKFLNKHKLTLGSLGMDCAHYAWPGRGIFHISSPIIEKHAFVFKKGFLDLDAMARKFQGRYTKDANGNLHHLADRILRDFYIDELSSIRFMDIFHDNVEIINYGSKLNGEVNFYVICDGVHRVDYSLEYKQRPTDAIVVESKKEMLPYYALPRLFHPLIRLTSKEAERKFNSLDIDKIHLLNNFIRKVLHYNWEKAGLSISKLRSNYESF